MPVSAGRGAAAARASAVPRRREAGTPHPPRLDRSIKTKASHFLFLYFPAAAWARVTGSLCENIFMLMNRLIGSGAEFLAGVVTGFCGDSGWLNSICDVLTTLLTLIT